MTRLGFRARLLLGFVVVLCLIASVAAIGASLLIPAPVFQ